MNASRQRNYDAQGSSRPGSSTKSDDGCNFEGDQPQGVSYSGPRRNTVFIRWQLQSEADRRVKLEEELRIASEAHINQKTAHDNVELALNQLQERFKAEQRVVRDLQATIDSLTARTEGDKQGRLQEKSALEKRGNQLQSRIQELELECHQLKTAPRSKFTNGRTSTSTVTTDPQFVWLQQENGRLRDLVAKHEGDTEAFERRISQLQTEMAKVENEKIAAERSWQAKGKELQAQVDDMSEELEYLRQLTGEGSASREQQLMDRIDEDAAKIEQLQRQVTEAQRMQSVVAQTEEKLRGEMKKVEEVEAMNRELVRDKDAAFDELEDIRAEHQSQQEQIRQLELREKYGSHIRCHAEADIYFKGTATTGGRSSKYVC